MGGVLADGVGLEDGAGADFDVLAVMVPDLPTGLVGGFCGLAGGRGSVVEGLLVGGMVLEGVVEVDLARIGWAGRCDAGGGDVGAGLVLGSVAKALLKERLPSSSCCILLAITSSARINRCLRLVSSSSSLLATATALLLSFSSFLRCL